MQTNLKGVCRKVWNKKEEMKREVVDKIYNKEKGGEMKLITETIENIEVLKEEKADGKKDYKIRGVFMQD